MQSLKEKASEGYNYLYGKFFGTTQETNQAHVNSESNPYEIHANADVKVNTNVNANVYSEVSKKD